ncbi:MAG: adenylate/guanylate cyclase domain-containing protein [Candidatus Velamenicoccus archaeovorus]
MPRCPRCGEENADRARFCQACGSPLQAATARREVRKTVTVVFCDVTGSTSLGERLDPETLRKVMTRYFEDMRTVLERHGATVEKFIGDAVMAVFGIPIAHEDDALRAARATVEMREAVERLSGDLERELDVSLVARIGVNTGEVVAGDPSAGQALVTGDTVNVAARLEQAAQPGHILIGADTYRLIRDAVVAEPVAPLALKGKSDTIPAFALARVIPGATGHARHLESPMVGRVGEATLLRQAFERAVRDRACQLFTVLGPAGVGKSRLVEESLTGLDGATVLRGRCLPYGEGITYFPVLEILKQAAGLSDFDAPEAVQRKVCGVLQGDEHQDLICRRLAQLLGVSEQAAAEETFWAIRRFLESVARAAPLIVVFDDVHWGEATFLDLIEHVADWSRDAPVLLLCMARSELLDLRPTWGGGKPNAATISLEPLSEDECDTLISNLLGAADIPSAITDRIQAAAEGNPLFVEEMLAMLIDDGLLEREDGRWRATGDLTAVSVPPTITALLTARIDRLSPDERGVLERAAVAGKQFHLGAVRELSPSADRDAIASTLMALVRKELIRPDRSTVPGEDAFRFRHLLIRDAAYEAMPKELRAELHERYAAWLERVAGGRIAEQEEIVGYHLAEAHRFRTELGPPDERAAELARRASSHLAAAAERATVRGDAPAAISLFEHAAGLLPPDDPLRLELLVGLGQARYETGEIQRASDILEEVASTARERGDRALEYRARLQGIGSTTTSMTGAAELAEDAIRLFEELGDERGLALAWLKLGVVRFWLGRSTTAATALEHALAHAEASGDRGMVAICLDWLPSTYWNGTTPTSVGIQRCTEILARAEHERRATWLAQMVRGVLHARRGGFDEARIDHDRATASLLEMGQRVIAAAHTMARGDIELLAGDPAAAVRVLEAGSEELERFGESGFRSTVRSILGVAYVELGRFEDARRVVDETEAAVIADDIDPQIRVRAVRALLDARAGHRDAAIASLDGALELAGPTDWSDIRGETLMMASRVHELLGDRAAARRAVEEALALFDQVESLVQAARARDRLRELG